MLEKLAVSDVHALMRDLAYEAEEEKKRNADAMMRLRRKELSIQDRCPHKHVREFGEPGLTLCGTQCDDCKKQW